MELMEEKEATLLEEIGDALTIWVLSVRKINIPHINPDGLLRRLKRALVNVMKNLKIFSTKVLVILEDSTVITSTGDILLTFLFHCFFLCLDLFSFNLGAW